MDNVSIVGIDIWKRSFQVPGVTADGASVLRRKLTRAKVLECLASQPRCLVVMETCGGAHHWERGIQQFGHEVRLIVPVYVKAVRETPRERKRTPYGPAADQSCTKRPDIRRCLTVAHRSETTAEEARRRAVHILLCIRTGEDPVPEPLAAKLAGGPTVGELAMAYPRARDSSSARNWRIRSHV